MGRHHQEAGGRFGVSNPVPGGISQLGTNPFIGSQPVGSFNRTGIWLPEGVRRRRSADTWKDPLREWGTVNPTTVAWTLTHTLTSAGETLIQPAAQYNVVLVRAWGAGGSASSDRGGNGGGGGYVQVYFTLNPGLSNFLAVVGQAGHSAQNGSSYTRLLENYSPNSTSGPRAFGGGGAPSTIAMGGGAQYWGGGGGGLSGVFWADSTLTSTQGSRYYFCTPIAIAGGGAGGSSYERHAAQGGYRADGNSPQDISYTRGTDALSTAQFASVRYGDLGNMYLRAPDGVAGGGFAGGYYNGSYTLGGSSFIWGRTATAPAGIGQSSTRALLDPFPNIIHSTSSAPASGGPSQAPLTYTDRPGNAGVGGSANGGVGTDGGIKIYMGTI
jgi:hypothetical protein